jgi:hypothetical protein
MIISGPRAAMLALPTLILPIGFALAQGGVGAGSGTVVAPSGTAVVGAPPSTAVEGGASPHSRAVCAACAHRGTRDCRASPGFYGWLIATSRRWIDEDSPGEALQRGSS